jgi:hypothetical protein
VPTDRGVPRPTLRPQVLDAAAQGGQSLHLVRLELAAVAQCAAGGAPGPAAAAAPAAAAPGTRAPSAGGSRGSSEPPPGGSGSTTTAAAAAPTGAAAPGPAPGVPAEVEVYCQTLFTLFDALSHWVTERKEQHEASAAEPSAAAPAHSRASSAGGSGSEGGAGEPGDLSNVRAVLEEVPHNVLARAALR